MKYKHSPKHRESYNELKARQEYNEQHTALRNQILASEHDAAIDKMFTDQGLKIVRLWLTRKVYNPATATHEIVRTRQTPEQCEAARKQGEKTAHNWLRKDTIDRREIGDCYLLPDGSVKPWSNKRVALTPDYLRELNYHEVQA